MDIKTELHNLKTMVLNESHISENSKEKIANRIFEIEKRVAINYTLCCKSDSEQLFRFANYWNNEGWHNEHIVESDIQRFLDKT